MAPIDPAKALPEGWRFLHEHDSGLIGSLWAAREAHPGFKRTLKVLGWGETYGTHTLKPTAVERLGDYVLPWQKKVLRTPAAFLLVSAVEPPERTFVPQGEAALKDVGAIARVIQAFHEAGISFNFLSPRAIGLRSSDAGPRPVFLDFGLSLRATLTDVEMGRVSSPALTPPNLAYWAPEIISKLNGHRPAGGFHPQADVYFLALAVVSILWGRVPFACSSFQDIAAGHELLPQAVKALGLGEKPTRLLLACVDRDPAQRLPAMNFFNMLKSPSRRDALWMKRRVGGGILTPAGPAAGSWGATGGTDTTGATPFEESAIVDARAGELAGATSVAPPGRSEFRVSKSHPTPPKAGASKRPKPSRSASGASVSFRVMKTLALVAAGAAVVLGIGFAVAWDDFLRQSPSVAARFSRPVQFPELDRERVRLQNDRRRILKSTRAGASVESSLANLHEVWLLERQLQHLWLTWSKELQEQDATGVKLLRQDVGSFLAYAGELIGATANAPQTDAAVLLAGRTDYRQHANEVRRFNASQAATLARAAATGNRYAEDVAVPVPVAPRPLVASDVNSIVDRTVAKFQLLRGVLIGSGAVDSAQDKKARAYLQQAYERDPQLIEALLEEGRLVARGRSSRAREEFRRRIRTAWEAFDALPKKDSDRAKRRAKRASEIREEVLKALKPEDPR